MLVETFEICKDSSRRQLYWPTVAICVASLNKQYQFTFVFHLYSSFSRFSISIILSFILFGRKPSSSYCKVAIVPIL